MTTPLERQRTATVGAWRADVEVRPQGAWTDLGGLSLHRTGIPVVYWNSAFLTRPSGLTGLDEATTWFGDLPWGVLAPQEWDVDLPHVTDQRVMLRDLAGLPDVPDLDLRWADAGAVTVQAAAFAGAHLEDFVLPKLTNPAGAVVTAYDGDDPVATATLLCVDGVAAVYGVGTVPSHRRQGLGAAVTVAVLLEGARRGCDLAFLNPSDEGYGVYAALGFTDAPGWSVYRPG